MKKSSLHIDAIKKIKEDLDHELGYKFKYVKKKPKLNCFKEYTGN